MVRTHCHDAAVHCLELLHCLEISYQSALDRTHHVEGLRTSEARLLITTACGREVCLVRLAILTAHSFCDLECKSGILLDFELGLIGKL